MKILEENLKMNNKSEDTIKSYCKIYKKYIDSKLDKFKFAEELKNKNLVSMFKNSLKYSNELNQDDEKKIDKIYKKTAKRKAIPKPQFKVLSFWNSINNCRNKKHKLPFRLSILSGLRIKELSNLKKEDITFLDNYRIKVHVKEGKGNKPRIVSTIMQDKYLYENLKELLENKKDTDKVFYSKNYLHKIAKKHNFQNHDLRKTCIQTIYYKCDKDSDTTTKLIQSYLGHNFKSKTYKYYLSRDINATNTRFDI